VLPQRRGIAVLEERRTAGDHGFARLTSREGAILAGVGLVVLLAAAAALGGRWWRPGLVGEWATYMVLAYAILRWQPFRSAVGRSGRPQRAAVAGCLLLLVLGQFVGGGRHTFPFVRFAMFTDPGPPDARYFSYLGLTRAGRSVQVDPVALYPSLDRGRFAGRLVDSAEAAIAGGSGSAAGEAYDDLLLALVRRENVGRDDPLVRLDVYLVHADLDPPPRRRTAVAAQWVWSVEAGG
jgi:multisubunit Na+/H+ antiporter MnhB subunit